MNSTEVLGLVSCTYVHFSVPAVLCTWYLLNSGLVLHLIFSEELFRHACFAAPSKSTGFSAPPSKSLQKDSLRLLLPMAVLHAKISILWALSCV